MGRSLWAVVVVILSANNVFCSGLLEQCPNSYSITRTYSRKPIVISIKERQGICQKILSEDKFELVSNDNLQPQTSVIQKDGEYFLNFTWRASVVDGKFPKTFLLLLDYSIPKQNIWRQSECIALKLKGRRKADEHESSSYFSFHCIRLMDDSIAEAGNVSIQILNNSHKKVNGWCTRHRRAVAPVNMCQTVECSEERHHSLALDIYKTEICSCYHANHGHPRMDAEYIPGPGTVDFNVKLTNLPAFLSEVNIKIIRDGSTTVWTAKFNAYDRQEVFKNGTIQFITNGTIQRKAGNYSLSIFRRCLDNRMSHSRPSTCFITDTDVLHLKEVTIEATPVDGAILSVSSTAIFVVFLGAVLGTAGVTAGMFIMLKKTKSRAEGNIEQHSPNSEQLTELTEQQTELTERRDTSNQLRVAYNPTRQTVNTELNIGMDNEQSTELRELPERHHTISDHNTRRQPLNNEGYSNAGSPDELEDLLRTGEKVLLHHPSDVNHTLQHVRSQLWVKLLDGRDQNWRDFAFTAVSKYHDVVVFVSNGLIELLCGDEKTKAHRLADRHYENVPWIVLQTLKELVQADRYRNDFFVHIVSSNCDKGKELISKFLEKHKFLRLTENYCVYYISTDFYAGKIDDIEFVKLSHSLERGTSSQPDESTL